jgi:hypothetical protein
MFLTDCREQTPSITEVITFEVITLMSQAHNYRFGGRVCGVLVLAALIFASLLLPPQLEQLRSGHWGIEHFLAYLAAVPIICLGWPRPFLVATTLIPAAALLEGLQCLEPDHSPNIFAALSSVGGGVAGALLATLMIRDADWSLVMRKKQHRTP